MMKFIFAIYVFSRSVYASADPGVITCLVEHNGGLTQKIVVYTAERKTYAINGQARQRATRRGWIDGKLVFTPEQMQRKLVEGLAKCS